MSQRSQDRQDIDDAPGLTRRSFIASLAVLVALGGTTLGPGARPAAAVAPVVVIAVAQLAISLIGLFRSQGSGIDGLLRLQTEILQRISTQLAVIQEGINLILKRLDEIEALIGKIPQAVVTELHRAQITALLGRYDEILRTYEADVRAKGIAFAQRSNLNEIERELLIPLRSSRDVLMTYDNRVNLPLLAAALYTETHSMILANYRPTRIIQAIKRYQSWIDDLLRRRTPTGLQMAISETRTARKKLLVVAEESREFGCIVQSRGWDDPNCIHPPLVRVGGVDRRGRRSFLRRSIDEPALASAVQSLLGAQVIAFDEIPLSLGATIYKTGDFSYNDCVVRLERNFTKEELNFRKRHNKACDVAQAAVEGERKALAAQLESNSMQIIALRSLERTAMEALAFADGMIKDLLTPGRDL